MRLRNPLALAAGVALALVLLAWAAVASNRSSLGGVPAPRTIDVSMTDGLRFDPDGLAVRACETIRFVITNPSPIDHEFMVGDEVAQRMHATEMASGMMHDDARAISVPAGRNARADLYVRGTRRSPGRLSRPGHYEAGMYAAVAVTP